MVVFDVLIYLGFGIAFLVAPEELLGAMDITFGSAASFAEVRAMYGGVELGIGLFLLGTFRGWVSKRQALALSGLAIGLLGTVRMAAVLTMPEVHELSLQFASIEIVGGLANLSAWWVEGTLNRDEHSHSLTAE